jgi:hypothetical protein
VWLFALAIAPFAGLTGGQQLHGLAVAVFGVLAVGVGIGAVPLVLADGHLERERRAKR